MEINVREARSRLRSLLDRVRGGESVTLTRRGEPVARIVPPEDSVNRLPSLEEFRRDLRVTGDPVSAAPEDIRWKRRFSNYTLALQTLRRAVELAGQRPLSELEQQGLIQGFEFTHELGWNVLKDYLESQGIAGLVGSKDASREAFRNGLILEGEAWMDMIKARNLTSHTYNVKIAEGIVHDILDRFFPAFTAMEQTFSALAARTGPDR